MQDYRYLFPYEKIPPRSKVLIYGAGLLGQEYLKQILITKYCDVVGFIDKNYEEYSDLCVPVYSLEQIGALQFDYIVLAFRGEIWLPEVKRSLLEQGVEESSIIYVLERINIDPDVSGDKGLPDFPSSCAYEIASPSMAILLAGGLGDLLIQKRLVMELIRMVPAVKIDLYAVSGMDFLQWLYSDCTNINSIIPDLGTRYSSEKEKYSLSFQIVGSGFLEVEHFRIEDFGTRYGDFASKVELLQHRCKEEKLSVVLPSAIMFQRRIYNGENCYTGFNYGGVFSIRDKHVAIPLWPEDERAYEGLGLSRYITVNVGNGSGAKAKTVSKAWPFERFQRTVNLFKKRYPDIAVVQIGAEGEERLQGADRAVMGQPFGLVACVLRHALFHLDIEGGLVHLASQLEAKCIVLFGPTPEAYYGYDNNINIKSGNCHGCYGYYLDTNRCVRHMEEPECMYSITPEIVIEKIDKYLKGRHSQ